MRDGQREESKGEKERGIWRDREIGVGIWKEV